MIVVSLLYLCSFCCDTRWVSGKGRRKKEAFSAFLLFPSLVSEISTNQTLMRLLTANEVMTANTHTHTHTLPHVHFHLFNYKKNLTNLCSPLCSEPTGHECGHAVRVHLHTHTYTHTLPIMMNDPLRAELTRETTSSCYSSFFGPSHSLIHFPPSGLSRTRVLFLISSLTHSPAALNPFCISVLNSCSSFKHPLLINLLPRFFDSCAPVLLAPSEVLPNKKHLQSEIWTWTLNSGLVCLGEVSIRRATAYTGRCSHTQRHLPPYM